MIHQAVKRSVPVFVICFWWIITTLLIVGCIDETGESAEPVVCSPIDEPCSGMAGGEGGQADREASPSLRYQRGEGDIAFVLMVSVDGLAPRFVDQLLEEGELPSFALLKALGAWTHNGRNDPAVTVTLPNHTSMLTGRPVTQGEGMPETAHHGYTDNSQPADDATLHNAGNDAVPYFQSLFDVAHDHGLKTCLFSGKDKFVIFERSYDEEAGAPDPVGDDNGRNKIDTSVIIHKSAAEIEDEVENGAYTDAVLDAFDEEMADDPCQVAFIHLSDTDPIGHRKGWGSSMWLDVLRITDERIGRLLEYVYLHPRFAGKTALLVTADHGGEGRSHDTASLATNFTVPFYAVGPGFASGTDLYDQCENRTLPPGDRNPAYSEPSQPIRNADISNLALELFDLPPIEGSVARDMGCL